MSRGETLEDGRIRTAVEVELDMYLQEIAYPALGQQRFGKLLDLIDRCATAHYGRGYMQGGRDEKAW